jgi:hypothetical protein
MSKVTFVTRDRLTEVHHTRIFNGIRSGISSVCGKISEQNREKNTMGKVVQKFIGNVDLAQTSSRDKQMEEKIVRRRIFPQKVRLWSCVAFVSRSHRKIALLRTVSKQLWLSICNYCRFFMLQMSHNCHSVQFPVLTTRATTNPARFPDAFWHFSRRHLHKVKFWEVDKNSIVLTRRRNIIF